MDVATNELAGVSRYRRAQAAVWRALGGKQDGSMLEGRVELFLLLLILANVVALVLESVEGIRSQYGRWFFAFEAFSVGVFTVEYGVRVWAAGAEQRYRGVIGRVRFALTPMAVVDLLAVLPFYLPFLGADLRVVRAVRLLRAFRILKLGRYSAALLTIGRLIRGKKEELVATLIILFMLLVLASSLMYYAEHEAQPGSFSSIPATMWWGIVTITTIGYGDMYPVTAVGKCLAGVIALIGIGMFALPTSILGSAFLEEAQAKHRGKRCPHCGEEIG